MRPTIIITSQFSLSLSFDVHCISALLFIAKKESEKAPIFRAMDDRRRKSHFLLIRVNSSHSLPWSFGLYCRENKGEKKTALLFFSPFSPHKAIKTNKRGLNMCVCGANWSTKTVWELFLLSFFAGRDFPITRYEFCQVEETEEEMDRFLVSTKNSSRPIFRL